MSFNFSIQRNQIIDSFVSRLRHKGGIDEVQNYLGRKILVENVSMYLQFESSEMNEAEFSSELVTHTVSSTCSGKSLRFSALGIRTSPWIGVGRTMQGAIVE